MVTNHFKRPDRDAAWAGLGGFAVERWLPELSARRVLRSYDAELSDTAPAARPVTVEDVLSFRLGFGCIFTPQAQASQSG
jgi:hypothetical protein